MGFETYEDAERFAEHADYLRKKDKEDRLLASSLCWKCSKEMAFHAPTCPACGATNPNVNFQKAIDEAEHDA